MTLSDFDDIRPYTDAEIPAAMSRIADNPTFPILASYIYPGRNISELQEYLRSIRTVRDLQLNVMHDGLRQVIRNSMTEFTSSGIENIEKDKCYLYVSNHRDIVLDATLQQLVLALNDMDTSEITFGANLMSSQFIVDIGKSNKMFRVERPGLSISSPKAFYMSSMHLSDYIRFTLTQKKQSVWIAQRNGRTKDGIDKTDLGILKMFGMSSTADKVDSLAELNIAPISISYEWEPCDILKALELYESSRMTYEKKPGEDMNSVISGLIQNKGHVHMTFCKPIEREELEALSPLTLNGFRTAVAEIIDKRICSSYELTPNNWIAHDIRHASHQFKDKYTDDQKNAFVEHMRMLDKYDTYNKDELTDIFLGIYANPVDSKAKYCDSEDSESFKI